MKTTDLIETQIPASQVRLGMYVVRLDRPWAETDFPLQGFLIRTPEDMHAIQEQCDFVFVEGKVVLSAAMPTGSSHHQKPHRRVTYINKLTMEDEADSAMASFHQCRNLAKNIYDSVRLGRVIDLNEVRPVVKEVVASILRNHSALLWLTQIRNKDDYTAEHSMNVCVLAAAFGKHLGLLEGEIETLALSGLLHDVGKIRIDASVLNKAGAFTPEELAHMKEHPEHGRRILMSVHGLEPIAVDVAHAHHEQMCGKGYPRGLQQHQIPYFAKIVSVVDAYDAITGNRVYDSARSSKQALDIIYKCRGGQFDDELALEFIRFIGIYPAGSLVELTTGEIGLVLRSNPDNRLRPKVIIVRDTRKQTCPERIVDLMTLNVDHGSPVQVTREWPNGSFEVDLKAHLQKGLKLEDDPSKTDSALDEFKDIFAHYGNDK